MTRSERAVETLIAVLVFLSAWSFWSFLTQAPSDSLSTLIRIAAAKCPGIPGGQNSGGPDFINIAIDAGLVALFVLFLFLTIRDMRRRKKLRDQDESEEAEEDEQGGANQA